MKTLVAIGKTNTGLYFHLESNNFKTKKAYKESLEAVGMKVEAIFGEDQITEIQSDNFKCNTMAKNYVWDTDFAFQGEISDKGKVGNVVEIEYRAGFNVIGMMKVVVVKTDRDYKGVLKSVEAIVTESENYKVGERVAFDGTYFKRMGTLVIDTEAELNKRLEAEKQAEREKIEAEKKKAEAEKKREEEQKKKASVFNEVEQGILDKLVAGNMEWYERMSAKLKEDGYKEWHKKMLAGYISSTDLSIMKSSEEFARKTFTMDAKHKIILLKLRVQKIVGNIQKYNLTVANNGDLEGYVEGDNGKQAKISIFYAGGYNIQRLHFRSKVTKVK